MAALAPPPRGTRRTLRMAALAPPPRGTRRRLQMAALAPPPAPRCGGTLIRASCARAPARAGARFAAARFARLTAPVRPRARAGRRTHLSRRFRPGFFAPAPTRRDTASGRRSRFIVPFLFWRCRAGLQALHAKFLGFVCHEIDLTGINIDLRAQARPPPRTPVPGPGRLPRKVAVRFGRAAGPGRGRLRRHRARPGAARGRDGASPRPALPRPRRPKRPNPARVSRAATRTGRARGYRAARNGACSG